MLLMVQENVFALQMMLQELSVGHLQLLYLKVVYTQQHHLLSEPVYVMQQTILLPICLKLTGHAFVQAIGLVHHP